MHIRWSTAFLDTGHAVPATERFWCSVTQSTLSARRGVRQQFVTLLPASGDPYLRMQTTQDGTVGCHLDLHVADVATAADEAVAAGATIALDEPGLVSLRSPAGLSFCLVAHHGDRVRPSPIGAPASLLDQLSIDVPAGAFFDEVRWWSSLTGWAAHPGAMPEFAYLERPSSLPLRLLFQRLAEPGDGRASAHVDLAAADREREVTRHLELGASLQHHARHWTVLRDPAGRRYCVTDRDPGTGRLHLP